MTRFNRIVCPVDFSECSRRALDHAVAIAHMQSAHVRACHVHQLVAPVAAGPLLPGEDLQIDMLTEDERAQLEQSLRDWVAEDVRAGASIDTAVAQDFNVPAAILAHADAIGADLITLATHGRSGFRRFVLGSVTEKVLRTSRCAVIVVPPHAPNAVPRPAVAYERLLCPVDFSAGSRRILEAAAGLAHGPGGRITAAHIVEIPSAIRDQPLPSLEDYRHVCFEQARRCMTTLTAGLRQAVVLDELLLAGKPAHEILRLAKEQEADLIVMGAQGRGAVDRLLFGSVTQQIVRQASCPVLVLPSTDVISAAADTREGDS